MKKTLLLILSLAGMFFCTAAGAQSAVVKETRKFVRSSVHPLYLDRYDIPSEDVKPCVIFMFGGGFVTGARDHSAYVPFFHFLAENGYTVVSIDYRLGMKPLLGRKDPSPADFILTLFKTVHDAAVDLFEATAYVLKHSEEWKIDRDMIITCGSSAGAVSVLQAEYLICKRDGAAKQYLPREFNYAGVISFAGAVLTMDSRPKFRKAPCPVLLFHGDADSNVPYDRLLEYGGGFYGSKVIAEQMREREYPYVFYSFENAVHEIAVSPVNDNREEILSFLNKLVKGKQPLMIDAGIKQVGKPEMKKDLKMEDFIKANFSQQ